MPEPTGALSADQEIRQAEQEGSTGLADLALGALSGTAASIPAGLSGMDGWMEAGFRGENPSDAAMRQYEAMKAKLAPYTYTPQSEAAGKLIGAVSQIGTAADRAAGRLLGGQKGEGASDIGNRVLGPGLMAAATTAAALPFPEMRGPSIYAELPFAETRDLYHWSTQPGMKQTDPALYGKGIKGAEAARIRDNGAPAERSYFYTDPITKEPGLGPHQYQSTVHGLYNAEEDLAGLHHTAVEDNTVPRNAQINPGTVDHDQAYSDFENKVKQWGYTGIVYPSRKAAVLFHPVNVREVAPVRPAVNHESAAQSLRDTGGFSVDPRDGTSPTTGYMYSPYPEHTTELPGYANPQQIMAYSQLKRDVVEQDPRNVVGGWMSNGNSVLDVSRNEPNLSVAAEDAWRNNQKAIFDLDNMKEIPREEYVKAIPPDPKLAKAIAKDPALQDTHDMLRAYITPEEYARLTPKSLQALHAFSQAEIMASPEELASMASAGIVKKGWYDASGKALVHVFGDEDAPRFAALLAALSPQTSVEGNLTNALNVWRGWVDAGRPTDRKSIKKIMGAAVQGDKGEKSVLGAWLNNSVAALSVDDPTSLTLSGPKVHSFYGNLRGIVNEVTNDSWQAEALGVSQRLFAGANRTVGGVKGPGGKGWGYILANARTREAADILSKATGMQWSPAEVQETVWSWVKTMVEARRDGLLNKATIPELVGQIGHPDIAGTPDFSTLLHNQRYADILRGAGYGPQLDTLKGKGLLFGTTAPDAARPYGAETLGAVARRLEQQYQSDVRLPGKSAAKYKPPKVKRPE